jgi:hypothetical protein
VLNLSGAKGHRRGKRAMFCSAPFFALSPAGQSVGRSDFPQAAAVMTAPSKPAIGRIEII